MTHITLCMIVKNESQIITRCLEAAKQIIDAVSIVDTGSTDDTKQIINDWCAENKIACTLHDSQFKNFGHNRSESYTLAFSSYPTTDYLLLCDADMILSKTAQFDKTLLDADAYYLTQKNKSIEYENVRLIKNIPGWASIGVTHEYTSNQSGKQIVLKSLKSLYFIDEEDGGCKTEKFSRDITLLSDAIAALPPGDPLLTRYHFYLAQSYKDTCRYDQATEHYEKCLAQSTWSEERYICHMRIAEMKSPQRSAIISYLSAHNEIPTRYEALYELTKLFNNFREFKTALLFAPSDAKYYETDTVLFNNINDCKYRLPIERTVALANSDDPKNKVHFKQESQELLQLWDTDENKNNELIQSYIKLVKDNLQIVFG